MKEITLDELIAELKVKEAVSAEPSEFTEMLAQTAEELYNVALQTGKVKILTDYDSDGIWSAYILEKTLRAVNPDMDLDVICNDRRNHYGVPKGLAADKDASYIIMDMGSNELPYIHETFGKDTIVIDHHLIEDEADKEMIRQNPKLLNAYSLDTSPEYCTAGLAKRLFDMFAEYAAEIQSLQKNAPEKWVKLNNSVSIAGAIGTIGDVVNLNDVHSYNRTIVKEGIEKINEADESNIDYMLGYFLTQCGVDTQALLAEDIAFRIVPVCNVSRMDSIVGAANAQKVFEALTGDESDPYPYFLAQKMVALNEDRKELVKQLQDERYNAYLDAERSKDSRICVYILDENNPAATSSMCGLIAGKIAEATDKACIVLVKQKDGTYSGSGRNGKDNAIGIKEFVDGVVKVSGSDFTIAYGGHVQAIGISKLDNVQAFLDAVESHQHEMKSNTEEKIMLKITIPELNDPETLDKVKTLEPTGAGLKIPEASISGKLVSSRSIGKNPNWKRLVIEDTETKEQVAVTCWNREWEFYQKNKDGNITIPVNIGLNQYQGIHVECTASFDRDFANISKELTHGKAIER